VLPNNPASNAVRTVSSGIGRFPCGRRGRTVIVEQDLQCRGVEVIELPAAHRPEERPHRYPEQYECQRNQEIETAHALSAAASSRDAVGAADFPDGDRMSRMAFITTRSELSDMPSAAIQGCSRPLAASGTAIRL